MLSVLCGAFAAVEKDAFRAAEQAAEQLVTKLDLGYVIDATAFDRLHLALRRRLVRLLWRRLALADGAAQASAGADALKDGMGAMRDTLVGTEKEAAGLLLPFVENELADALRIYEQTRDSVKNSGYDLRPEGMKTVTVYIIRTDLQ